MKKINLAVTGCLGRMGQQIIKSAKTNKHFKLIALTENKKIKKKKKEKIKIFLGHRRRRASSSKYVIVQ